MDTDFWTSTARVLAVLAGVVFGSVSISSACWVWVRQQIFGYGGSSLCGAGVILLGLSIWHSVDFGVGGTGLTLKLQAALERLQNIDERTSALAENSTSNTNELHAALERLQVIAQSRPSPKNSWKMTPAIGQEPENGQKKDSFNIITGSLDKTSKSGDTYLWYITPHNHIATFMLTPPLGVSLPVLGVTSHTNQLQSVEILQKNGTGTWARIASCPVRNNAEAYCSLFDPEKKPEPTQIRIHTSSDDQIEISLGGLHNVHSGSPDFP